MLLPGPSFPYWFPFCLVSRCLWFCLAISFFVSLHIPLSLLFVLFAVVRHCCSAAAPQQGCVSPLGSFYHFCMNWFDEKNGIGMTGLDWDRNGTQGVRGRTWIRYPEGRRWCA